MSDSHKPLLSTQGDDATVNLERQYVDNVNLEVGLTGATVEERFARFGPNELVEEEVNMFLKFLTYFWGPMPIMIWVAVIIELAKACAGQGGWEDFAVLLVLQILNGCVGFIEEKNAGNAIAALKKQLAPMCRVKRDGKWTQIESRLLVPGDLLKVKLGDIVPADAIILDGEPLQVDQAALTGESLPVTIHPGGKIKMGSAIKRGEIEAVVVATGKDTFFGKAADMMNIDDAVGRFQKVLFKITLGLLGISSVLTLIIFVDLLVDGNDVLRAVSVCVVLLVASIPIAMQVVCTSTMAVGSRRLAQKKVIVARLGAIEELAGMTILCSDKTGTLTLNKLSLREPIRMGDMEESELIFYSALAAVQDAASQDAIDLCICNAVHEGDKSKLQHFTVLKYIPFNPTDKRTESTVKAPDGSVFKITKGAPQVILRMAFNAPEIQDQVDAAVQDLADRGFRALGVAISYTGVGEEPKWEFQGVLSLFDPPRLDTKDTIEKANENGVEVKMVTGDQTAIAKETCRELGMGTNILNTDVLVDPAAIGPGMDIDDIILNSNGFAEVFPEHKFEIVDRIRKRGFVVGMTGDGVNDAPALKRADIGIAVEGATDAAKAAADIVLIEPGLSVIIDAILRSRKIFQRMRNYSIYRIACTIELLFFFFFAVLTIKPAHFFGSDGEVEKSFTLPVIALVVITILNDGTIISIAHDKVIPENRPQKWDLTEVVIVSNCLGLVACLSSMILLVFGMQGGGTTNTDNWFVPFMAKDTSQGISYGEIMTMMYLKVSLSDFLTVFSARTTGFFWERRPGYALAAACVVATGSSTGLALGWPFKDAKAKVTMTPLDGKYAVLTVWVYCLIWFVLTDFVKVILYKVLAAVRTQEEDIVEALHKKGRLTNAMENDRLTRRADGVRRETSSMLGATRQDVGAMQKRLQQLEAADKAKAEQLKSLMSEISTLKAQMSGPSAGTAAEE